MQWYVGTPWFYCFLYSHSCVLKTNTKGGRKTWEIGLCIGEANHQEEKVSQLAETARFGKTVEFQLSMSPLSVRDWWVATWAALVNRDSRNMLCFVLSRRFITLLLHLRRVALPQPPPQHHTQISPYIKHNPGEFGRSKHTYYPSTKMFKCLHPPSLGDVADALTRMTPTITSLPPPNLKKLSLVFS